MASVTSLDKDMRKLRMDRYTPQAAKEVRDWVEDALGERLPSGDLMEALKDGVALCKLVNMAIPPPGVKYKPSPMPFVQMENISHFLRACQSPPLNLQPHDVFLTVDLYESKDPAQVIQCMGSFSRVANKCAPSRFPNAIGPKSRAGLVSPQVTGTPKVGGGSYGNRDRGISNASNSSSAYNSTAYSSRTSGTLTPTRTGDSNSGRWSPTKNGSGPLSPGTTSSWSRKEDEGSTAPAWNINQYGYMGGASQGNMGVAFGARRQITSAGPNVPSLAEKEKKRKEEEERMRIQMEEAELRRRVEREAEEERARIAEEERWAEETKRLREKERLKVEEEKRRWEEEERKWKMEEEKRQEEERNAEARLDEERRRARGSSDARLHGQFLSQYQASQAQPRGEGNNLSRIQELEKELELARERERQYERERQERLRSREYRMTEEHDLASRMKEEARSKSRNRSRSRPREPAHKSADEVWREDERDYLRREWAKGHDAAPSKPPKPPKPLQDPAHEDPPQKPPRQLPEPLPPVRVMKNNTGPSSRPLPDPASYVAPQTATYTTPAPTLPSRTDRFLSSNPAPKPEQAHTTYSSELGAFDSAAERDAEDRRRKESQAKTKAAGWAGKSLLEREMEMERQRQKEWEEGQINRTEAAPRGAGLDGAGASGVGGRRGIVGPRPPPGR